jgi:surface protein
MGSMFYEATLFNQNIGSWDTSLYVTDMSYMFYGASAFNNNNDPSIGSWNPLNVTNMSYMFKNATVFNRDISGWNVSNVIPNPKPNFSAGSALTNAQLPPAFRV